MTSHRVRILPPAGSGGGGGGGGGGGTDPAWRVGLTVGQWYSIPNTAMAATAGGPYTPSGPGQDPLALLTGWSGFARINNEWWTCAPGGHGHWLDEANHAVGAQAWQNPVMTINFQDDAPSWRLVDQGSVYTDAAVSVDYYADGRATSRHQYFTPCGVPAGVCSDGKKRVIMPTAFARFDPDNGGNFSNATWAYRCDDGLANPNTNQWDAPGTWPAFPGGSTNNIASVCQHPTDYRIFVAYGPDDADNFYVLNPATGGYTRAYVNPTYPNPTRIYAGWPNYPSCIDTTRNRIIAYAAAATASPAESSYLIYILDISGPGTIGSPYQLSVTNATGAEIAPADPWLGPKASRMVYDPINDRFFIMKAREGTPNYIEMFSMDQSFNITSLGTIAGLAGTDSMCTKMHYFPSLGGFMLQRLADVNAQFYPLR